ncbi:hypothetical protein FRC09_018178 [Ceratobasidium sp. 395]|nr:hypothetical protein FRC09_018178 [Ceratobasidium sp. 395]
MSTLPFPLGTIAHLIEALGFSLLPTLQTLLTRPSLLFRPSQLAKISFAHLWEVLGPGIDSNSQVWKHSLLYPHASGVVLDVGAGHGHTMQYLDKTRVSKYVAVEPNEYMHEKIKEMANKCGFDDVVILGCGAENVEKIKAGIGGDGQADTIVAILTLCSIKEPKEVASGLVNGVLRSGGQVLWCEHIVNPIRKVQLWQRIFSPIWGLVFDGCRLGQDTVGILLSAGPWLATEIEDLPGEEAKNNTLYHKMGRFVKA